MIVRHVIVVVRQMKKKKKNSNWLLALIARDHSRGKRPERSGGSIKSWLFKCNKKNTIWGGGYTRSVVKEGVQETGVWVVLRLSKIFEFLIRQISNLEKLEKLI
jgi:hypothetical protein